MTRHVLNPFVVAALMLALVGCGVQSPQQAEDFQTSGNRDADQRAAQRIAKDQQIGGADGGLLGDASDKSLYEQLGGEPGIRKIVDDFVDRAMADPRVNWNRQGVVRGGVLGVGGKSATWEPTEKDVMQLKARITQFLALATGGPTVYQGDNLAEVHEGMRITNAQFDAAVGDLKATLDKLAVRTEQQKFLLSIVESTREQIVEQR
jgi:hemoglobin